MDITPAIAKAKQLITGYGNGGFKINHEQISGSLLLFPTHMMPWAVPDASHITLETLEPMLESDGIEILLIGTGSSIASLDPAIRTSLRAHHIALEIMDTGAACRTYNVLMSEERRVAAALIAV